MARGRSRSLEISEVIKHAREIETSGYSEVVLTGIHLGSYGHDLEPKANLSELLRYILKNTKIPRIRLSSLAVKEVDNELIELLKEERICKHLHLPLQSGDDRILRLMNRQYTSREYLATVEDILKKVPDIALGTDIIVGFPGEGDEEFINTKRLIGALPISYIHIFPFSQRPNTLAYRMPKQNTSEVKRERLNELKAINAKKKMAYMLSQMSRTLEVIIEEQGDDNIAIGTSSNYLKVEFPSNGYNKGALVRVRAVGMVGNIVRADSVDKL
jgi:threonylcarbamoyladenosine tRNA methylthiotransferase MtaB